MAKRKTVCFSGMERAENDKLKSLFTEANRNIGSLWTLAPESEAEMLIIDVDTLYGHMTWLKLHNSGRIIVALSSSPKAEADHVLRRPLTVESLASLLRVQADTPGNAVAATPPAALPDESTAFHSAPNERVPPLPEPLVPEVTPEPPPPARGHSTLLEHLQPGALPGPVKLKLDDAPLLVLDPLTRTYLGGTALKPYLPYAKTTINAENWTAVTSSELEQLKSELGGVQPFARLQWLSALVMGEGQLARGYDPTQKYRLPKWPQIEREFPKHFRIATAMMKGPQLLNEIAEASGASLAEVSDFVNACLATGFAELDVPPPASDPTGSASKSGLLGRLRGTR